MLQSLINDLRKDNFDERVLNRYEVENLVAALRSTIKRLLNEHRSEFITIDNSIQYVIDIHHPEEAFSEAGRLLQIMAQQRENNRNNHSAKQVMEIKNFVSTNFKDFNLGLTSIAEAFNMSGNYLSSFFKENEGEGLESYIQRKRMDVAVSMLVSDPEATMDQVSSECGYPNTSSFRRAFKRVTGLSPSEYRSIKQR